MECFKRFRNIDSHFASEQILKDFERSNCRRVNEVIYMYTMYVHVCGDLL